MEKPKGVNNSVSTDHLQEEKKWKKIGNSYTDDS